MTLWNDVLVGVFAFFLQFTCISFLALYHPLFYYVNGLIPVGVFFLLTKERFSLRMLLLLGIAFCLDILSFAPFGLWLFRVTLLLGSAFLWMGVFSQGSLSLLIFFFVYPFWEFFLERVALSLVGSGTPLLSSALLGKFLSVVLGLSLSVSWLSWREKDVE